MSSHTMHPKTPESTTSAASSTALSRRRVFGGAATLGAVAAVAAVLPSVPEPAASLPADRVAAAEDGGYRVTEHIRRYYQTARV